MTKRRTLADACELIGWPRWKAHGRTWTLCGTIAEASGKIAPVRAIDRVLCDALNRDHLRKWMEKHGAWVYAWKNKEEKRWWKWTTQVTCGMGPFSSYDTALIDAVFTLAGKE